MESEVPEEETPRATISKKKTKRRGRRLTGLSKQRRIANTRERNRVHVINEGIDRLRDLIPLFPNEKKPSKTDTIRLAALYISHLTELLEMQARASQADKRQAFPAAMLQGGTGRAT